MATAGRPVIRWQAVDGHGGWSRSGDDRQQAPVEAGWYVDEGWRDGTGEAEEFSEPSGHYGTAGERYSEPARRYEEPRADPLRADLGPTELPRVTPARPEPVASAPPRVAPAEQPPPRVAPAEQPPPRVPPEPVAPAFSAPVRPAPPRQPVSAPQSPGPMGENVYRSKRPAAMIGFGVVAALLEIPALMLLVSATTADPVSVTGVVAAACLVCALPLAATGLYAVATGAVRAAGPNSVQAWLRPPVAYLTVALVLFVAAGLAA